jgi:hypothetical protein
MVFAADAPKPATGGEVTLLVNSVPVASGRIEHTVPGRFSVYAGMDIGRDNGLVVGSRSGCRAGSRTRNRVSQAAGIRSDALSRPVEPVDHANGRSSSVNRGRRRAGRGPCRRNTLRHGSHRLFWSRCGRAMVCLMGDAETATHRGRVTAVQHWLSGRADTPLGRLALEWFRAYFDSSRNSGCAATVYSSLSVLPAALVAVAYFHSSGSDTMPLPSG